MALTLVGCALALALPLELLCVVLTICAFCLRTSAGVSMKHDTASAVEEAIALIIGLGSECVNGRRKLVLEVCVKYSDLCPVAFVLVDESCKAHFIASYVVKNAPAICDNIRIKMAYPGQRTGNMSVTKVRDQTIVRCY